MSNYGETVRQLRMKKGISQKELYTDIMSKSYAIRFEQGKHDISFHLLQLILDRLTMEVDEFLYIANGYRPSLTEEFYHEYGRHGNANNLQGLRNMRTYYSQQTPSPQIRLHLAELTARIGQLEQFAAKGVFSKANLDDEAIHTIHAYLDEVQSWTLFDLRFFANTLDFLDYERKMDYFNSLLPTIHRYKGFRRAHAVICTLLVNEVHELATSHDFDAALTLLDELDRFADGVEDMLYRNLSLFYRGLVQAGQGQTERGEESIAQALHIFRALGYEHPASLFESIYSTFKIGL